MMVIKSDCITAEFTKNEIVKIRKLIGDKVSEMEADPNECDSHYYLELCQFEAKLHGMMVLMAAREVSDE